MTDKNKYNNPIYYTGVSMEQVPNPGDILTQAVITSMFSGLATFLTSFMANLFIKPVISGLSGQIASTLIGGAKSVDVENHPKLPVLPMLPPPIPPPLSVSVSPDGGLNLSFQANDFMNSLMSMFQASGGNEK